MSFHLTTIEKLPLNIFTVLHYHQLLPDIPTTSGSSRKGSNAIFLGKSTYEK